MAGVADFAPEAEHQVARSCVLSHRLARAQLPRALEVLAVEDRSVVLDAARRWDGDVRREWLLQ